MLNLNKEGKGNMTRWCFDLDNTLVKTEGSNYKESVPINAAVKKVREYYDRGDHIIIMTARGAGSQKDWRKFTAKQLKRFWYSLSSTCCRFETKWCRFFCR